MNAGRGTRDAGLDEAMDRFAAVGALDFAHIARRASRVPEFNA